MRCAAFAELCRGYGSWAFSVSSKIAAQRLLSLDRFEKCLEVTCTEALRALALNDFVKNRRTIFNRLRENLEQIAFVVPIHENSKLSKRRDVFVDFSDTLANAVVVRARNLQKLDPARLHVSNCLDDVVGRNCNVLHARAVVELEIPIDLRLFLSSGRLVARELDTTVAVRHHLRHKRGVLGRYCLVVERQDVDEAEHVLIELDPLVHRTELDVADAVVNVFQSNRLYLDGRFEWNEARHEKPAIVLSLDKTMDCVAIKVNRGRHDLAVL